MVDSLYWKSSDFNSPPDSPQYDSSPEQEILHMSVDLAHGERDNIRVYSNDDPELLAEAFCLKHNLGDDIKLTLVQQIQENVQKVSRQYYNQNISSNGQFKSPIQKRQGKFTDTSHQPKINENSRRIAENRIAGDAYQRLYAQSNRRKALNKNQSLADETNTIRLSQKQVEALGQRMYLKAKLKQQESNAKREQERIQRELENETELTFRPKINRRSHSLRNRAGKIAQQLLTDYGKVQMDVIERKRDERKLEEISECTFKPVINSYQSKNSTIQSDGTKVNRFDTLFYDAQQRAEKLQELKDKINQEECPFVPDTSASQVVSAKLDSYQQNAMKRLVNSKREYERVLEKQIVSRERAVQGMLIDPETGQEFFKPITGRAPTKVNYKQRDVSEGNIGEYLYQKARQSDKLRHTMSTSPGKPIQQNRRSDMIIKRLKYIRYTQLFNQMNPNDKGIITASTIQQQKLSTEMLQMLRPLIDEIQQYNETLTFDEFYKAMDTLMMRLNPIQKRMLLQAPKPQHPEEFQDLSQSKTASISSNSIYERLVKYKLTNQCKNELKRQRKHQDEMVHCTFRPKIKEYVPQAINLSLCDDLEFSQDLGVFGLNRSLCQGQCKLYYLLQTKIKSNSLVQLLIFGTQVFIFLNQFLILFNQTLNILQILCLL